MKHHDWGDRDSSLIRRHSSAAYPPINFIKRELLLERGIIQWIWAGTSKNSTDSGARPFCDGLVEALKIVEKLREGGPGRRSGRHHEVANTSIISPATQIQRPSSGGRKIDIFGLPLGSSSPGAIRSRNTGVTGSRTTRTSSSRWRSCTTPGTRSSSRTGF